MTLGLATLVGANEIEFPPLGFSCRFTCPSSWLQFQRSAVQRCCGWWLAVYHWWRSVQQRNGERWQRPCFVQLWYRWQPDQLRRWKFLSHYVR